MNSTKKCSGAHKYSWDLTHMPVTKTMNYFVCVPFIQTKEQLSNSFANTNLSSSSHSINTIYICHNGNFLRFRGCLVPQLKQRFSVFKQHYAFFYTLFHPHVFPKNTNNITS